jgi:serine/threonine-protein kinase HipA
MKRCPITYDAIENRTSYSPRGLGLLAKTLKDLAPFPYDKAAQVRLAVEMAAKISIQGVQPKLSARLDLQKKEFIPVERQGRYILKPQNPMFAFLPENEDLTMKLAAVSGCEVPLHGLIWSSDDSLTYFIKRVDRERRTGKVPVEDFAQLAGLSRDTKYDYSVEKVVRLIDTYMTFPVIEKAKFFRLFLFNFLSGNEDAHLKNYSVITRSGKQELSPCYDLVNTTLAIGEGTAEESALPLNEKKRKLNAEDLFRYLGIERLKLTEKTVAKIRSDMRSAVLGAPGGGNGPGWKTIIEKSFLDPGRQKTYWEIVRERLDRLFS